MATTAAQPPSQAQATVASSSSSAQAKPPVTIHPTAHLDPGAYVRGTHPILLDANVLVHPRAQLISIHGPLIIGAGTIVYEKAVLGGPVPLPTTSDSKDRANAVALVEDEDESSLDPQKTLVGASCSIQAHAAVQAGATVHEASMIEPHVIVQAGVTIGAHAKVCAGCEVDRDVGEWEVVLGDGRVRRKRAGGEAGEEQVERARLRAMQVDRETTVGLLKSAAKASLVRKK